MRVLVAGATGEIGRRLVPALLAAGHEVTGVTRTAGALDGTGASEFVGDVNQRARFLASVTAGSFDAVIHQLTSLRKSPIRYAHMRATNRLRSEGTSTLIAAARKAGAKKFVTASIFYGYGFGDLGSDALNEDAPFGELPGNHLDAVLRATVSNEQQVRSFGGVALRYGLFYGTGGDLPPVASDAHGVLPVIHIDDAVRATVLALDKGRKGHAYNIAEPDSASWRELWQAQAQTAGVSGPPALPSHILRIAAPFGSHLVTRTSMTLDSSKAKSQLKFVPDHCWRPAVAFEELEAG